MDYEKLITLASKFYSREALRKTHEEEATNLENFVQKVKEISATPDEEDSIESKLLVNRLNTQVRSLTGASIAYYDEFILLRSFFDPNTFIKDYRVYAQNREAFKLKLSSDQKCVKEILIQSKGHKKRIKNYRDIIVGFIMAIILYKISVGPVLQKWLKDEWHLPDLAQGIIVQGLVFFFITVIFRIFLDYEAYKALLQKIKEKNSEITN